jgi:hypothetical protein
MSITVQAFSAWFSVNTVHGSSLEFVLVAADSRKNCPRIGHEFTTYSDKLRDSLTKEFAKDTAIRVTSRQEYGDASFEIECESSQMLEQALERCGVVVQAWIRRYKINGMKE